MGNVSKRYLCSNLIIAYVNMLGMSVNTSHCLYTGSITKIYYLSAAGWAACALVWVFAIGTQL